MVCETKNQPRTVVMLQYTGIGDFIWHIQYFKKIAEQSQNGKVSIVVQPSTLAKNLIGDQPWVEAIIDHDHRPRRGEKRKGRHAGLSGMWRMAKELKNGQFDRIILFSGRNSRGLIAWLSGIPIRQGFGYRILQRWCLNSGPYIQAYKGQSLAVYPEASAFMIAQGYCSEPIVPKLDVSEAHREQMSKRLAHLPRPLYALAIGTSETHKQWGEENYASLAQHLLDQGAGVLIVGGPAEQSLAQKIKARLSMPNGQAPAALELVTDTPVLGSAAALACSDRCVGNDTGMINVAPAVGTKSYVVIGARGTLDHDPINLKNIRADSLAKISVATVLAELSNG